MFKPTLESITPSQQNMFLLRQFEEDSFAAPFHYHPEIELTLILKGEGKRFVGSHISHYSGSDLVLIGPNVPHCWKSENTIPGGKQASSIVIQFSPCFAGENFIQKPEVINIKNLLERSNLGIQFTGDIVQVVGTKIQRLQDSIDPFLKLLCFLDILHDLSLTRETVELNSDLTSANNSIIDTQRINAVKTYIVENFKNKVLLEKAADTAKLSISGFCKYYKKMTRTTFFETVNEYRVNYAAQLLINSDRPVSDIGYESGFGELSHFYRKFKQIKKVSPLKYREIFMEVRP